MIGDELIEMDSKSAGPKPFIIAGYRRETNGFQVQREVCWILAIFGSKKVIRRILQKKHPSESLQVFFRGGL